MKRASKRLMVAGVGALAFVGVGAVGWSALARSSETPTGDTYVVRRGEIVENASASGTIEPHTQVEVKSRASGEVIEVLVDEGQRVAAGDLLFRLDPTDAERAVRETRTALGRVQAELAQARAQLDVSQAQARDADAARDVSTRGTALGLVASEATRSAGTNAEVANANVRLRRSQLTAGEAQVATARFAVEEAERRLEETRIYAPVAGTVLSVTVERGSIVSSAVTNVSGGTALATIADLTDLRVIGAIDEAQIGRASVGQKVELRVDAFPERTFKGQVIRVSPLGVQTSNVVTFDVEIVVTDRDASLLRSGMSADLDIETTRSANVLLVPLTAIQSVGRQRFVKLASGEQRAIRTGATDGRRIVVMDGVREGDRILIGSMPTPAQPQQATKSLLPTGRPRRGSR